MGLAGFDVCAVVARLVVVFELVIGIAYLLGIYRRTVNLTALVSLVLFSLFLGWRMALGDERSCHCMGEIADLKPFDSLVKNVILGLMCWRLSVLYRRKGPRTVSCCGGVEESCSCCTSSCCGNVVEDSVNSLPGVKGFRKCNAQVKVFLERQQRWLLVGSLAVALILPFAVTPPDCFQRTGEGSHYFIEQEFTLRAAELGLDEGRKVLCFYSTACEFCQRCASRMAGIIRHYGLPAEEVQVIFMQSEENQESASRAFFEEYGEGLQLPFHVLHPFDFIPMTSGNMPLVLLIEDGKLVKEYDYTSLEDREIVDFLR